MRADVAKNTRSGIEVVITGLTRNQFGSNPTRVRIPPAAPSEAGLLFELFYRKTAPFHAVPIAITEFSKILDKAVLLKNGKSSYEKIRSGLHFRHRISHKSCVSSFPYSSSNLTGALYAKV